MRHGKDNPFICSLWLFICTVKMCCGLKYAVVIPVLCMKQILTSNKTRSCGKHIQTFCCASDPYQREKIVL